jgi:hypothetical protein
MYAPHDERPAVFGDHSNYQPVAFGEHLKATNVFDELPSVVAVLVTVVLDADPQLLPTHIDEGSEVSVGDPDLRRRPREAGIDQKHAKPRLAWRLRTRIKQGRDAPGFPDAPRARVAASKGEHIFDLDAGRCREAVEVCDRLTPVQVAGKIESSSGRRAHREVADSGDLVRLDAFIAHDNTIPGAATAPD